MRARIFSTQRLWEIQVAPIANRLAEFIDIKSSLFDMCSKSCNKPSAKPCKIAVHFTVAEKDAHGTRVIVSTWSA